MTRAEISDRIAEYIILALALVAIVAIFTGSLS